VQRKLFHRCKMCKSLYESLCVCFSPFLSFSMSLYLPFFVLHLIVSSTIVLTTTLAWTLFYDKHSLASFVDSIKVVAQILPTTMSYKNCFHSSLNPSNVFDTLSHLIIVSENPWSPSV